jgi:Uncharacterised protein family UPF0547
MKKLTTICVIRERGESKAQPQAGVSLLRRLLESLGGRVVDRCPKCRAKGFQSGDSSCRSCGWEDPILEPWVPSGWYSDPANPNRTRYWVRDTGSWASLSRKRLLSSPKPIPTTPPPGWLDSASGDSASAIHVDATDAPAAFRTARVVALIAALIAGALTATQWYVRSIETGAGTPSEGVSLWAAHSALGALIVAGAVLVAGTSAASLFRVPNDQPNLPQIALGFAVVAALAMVVCSIIGLADIPPKESELSSVHVTDSVWGVMTLLAALVAVGGTGVMFWAGREQANEALALSVTEQSNVMSPGHSAPVSPREDATSAAAHQPQDVRRDSDGDQLKRCPECAEWVKDAALVCRYCGFRFASTAEPTSKP